MAKPQYMDIDIGLNGVICTEIQLFCLNDIGIQENVVPLRPT